MRLPGKKSSYKNPQDDKTTPQLLIEMVAIVASWLPEHKFELSVDGAYANEVVVQSLPKNVSMLSRTRSDATLYDLISPQVNEEGQLRRAISKAEREGYSAVEWTPIKIMLYGEEMVLEVTSWVGLWYKVAKSQPLRFVLVRKPGHRYAFSQQILQCR